MLITSIVGASLLLQVVTIILSLRLILITGWKKAWLLLSLGITTMGLRRLVTFIELTSGGPGHLPELTYEVIGLIGSVIMLLGVVYIKPVFLSVTAAEKEQRALAERLQEALSKIRTLSGMLPICASCKKIRDDKGYWNQIEVYIRDRTDAEFSHGICPACAEKAFKELEELKKGHQR